MEKATEVRMPYTALLTRLRPDVIFLWGNDRFIRFAQGAGYDDLEFHCLHATTTDVLKTPQSELREKTALRSGHVIFNPYADLISILKRRPDPLRPREKLALYNLALAHQRRAYLALRRLERTFGETFPVVTYPYKINGEQPYGEYRFPLLQTHPAVFNDHSKAQDLIRLVQEGKYKGIVWDIYHAFEATADGKRPLMDWRRQLTPLLEADVIKEVHVQAGRVYDNDPTIPSLEWLQGMVGENPQYNSELGQIIRTVKAADPTIPFVVEINIDGLIKAGLIKNTSLVGGLGKVRDMHQQLVDYIRRV